MTKRIKILKKVKAVIDTIENTSNLTEIKHVKKLTSSGKYYRIKVGDYRVEIKLENEIVVFVRSCIVEKSIDIFLFKHKKVWPNAEASPLSCALF